MLTPEEAADFLKVTPATVRDWARRGLIVGHRFGRLWRFKQYELEQPCSTSGGISGGSDSPPGDAKYASRVVRIAASLRKNLSSG